MIILIGSQKGGCGKSTLCINIATWLANQGKDIAVLDADLQQSTANWIRDRDETPLSKIHCIQRYGDIKNTLKDLRNRYEYIVVDVAGHDSKELRTGMLCADKLVVPFRPSQFDLDTLPHLNDVVEQVKSFNEALQVYGLITLAPTNPTVTEVIEARDYLNDFPEFHPLKTIIHDRKVYRDVTSEGKGVIESNNEKAKAEINSLMEELLYGN
jgi:chromosome partitioning protein